MRVHHVTRRAGEAGKVWLLCALFVHWFITSGVRLCPNCARVAMLNVYNHIRDLLYGYIHLISGMGVWPKI